MIRGLKQIAAPQGDVVSVAEARDYARRLTTDDAVLTTLLKAATEKAEAFIRRALLTQDWTVQLEAVPEEREIELVLPPLQEVLEVRSYGPTNQATVFDAQHYAVDTFSEPGRLMLNEGAQWPTDTRYWGPMEIDIRVGYGDATKVPAMIKAGILRAVATWVECREDVSADDHYVSTLELPRDAAELLTPFRIVRRPAVRSVRSRRTLDWPDL